MPQVSVRVIKRLVGCLGGALLSAAVGCALLYYPFGQRLADLSYDVPFRCRSSLSRPDIIIVYIDTASRSKFQLPSGLLDRRKHVELLQRLTDDGARMVFFDIVFRDEVSDVDSDFAAAIRKHGNVVLGYYEAISSRETQLALAIGQESIHANRTLREAAQHYGLLMVDYPDSKSAVRRLLTGDAEHEAAVWAAARALDTNNVLANRLEERWLNFYRYPPAFTSVSFASALSTADVPPGFFQGKIVFVGAHPDDMASLTEREKFATPWGRYAFASGVEMLATSLGNLIQGNWLRRVPTTVQFAIIIGFGLLIGVTLSLLRPWTAAGVASMTVVLIATSALYLHYDKNLWWSWMIPVAAQVPLALVWSVGYQYAIASRREAEMQRAFSSYLSPHLVKRIAASDFDLSLGGKEVEATILFTDIEGFSAMAESLPPPEVSRLLTGYFERITTHILKHEGTIIKYVGDAVMAVWGAPLPDARQAERAVLAARGIIHSSQMTFSGRRLRTRIGINTGKALAGNLGSSFRFDYSVIGATTNAANRLENLNKVFGTDILIGDSTRRRLPKEILVRDLGEFILRGTSQPIHVHEVINSDTETDWLRVFHEAIEYWTRGEPTTAMSLLHKVVALRGGHDGPSEFYLQMTQSGAAKPGKPIKLS